MHLCDSKLGIDMKMVCWKACTVVRTIDVWGVDELVGHVEGDGGSSGGAQVACNAAKSVGTGNLDLALLSWRHDSMGSPTIVLFVLAQAQPIANERSFGL